MDKSKRYDTRDADGARPLFPPRDGKLAALMTSEAVLRDAQGKLDLCVRLCSRARRTTDMAIGSGIVALAALLLAVACGRPDHYLTAAMPVLLVGIPSLVYGRCIYARANRIYADADAALAELGQPAKFAE